MNEYFVAVWNAIAGGLAALALLTALDVIFGVVNALVHKKFEWQHLMRFLQTDVIPIFVWVAIVMLKLIPAILLPKGYTIPVISELVYAGLFLKMLGSIFKSFAELGVLTDMFGSIGVVARDSGYG